MVDQMFMQEFAKKPERGNISITTLGLDGLAKNEFQDFKEYVNPEIIKAVYLSSANRYVLLKIITCIRGAVPHSYGYIEKNIKSGKTEFCGSINLILDLDKPENCKNVFCSMENMCIFEMLMKEIQGRRVEMSESLKIFHGCIEDWDNKSNTKKIESKYDGIYLKVETVARSVFKDIYFSSAIAYTLRVFLAEFRVLEDSLRAELREYNESIIAEIENEK